MVWKIFSTDFCVPVPFSKIQLTELYSRAEIVNLVQHYAGGGGGGGGLHRGVPPSNFRL